MNKPFGLRGQIQPAAYFQDHNEQLSVEGIDIFVINGVLEVGYDSESDEARARELADLYLAAATVESEIKFGVDLNQSWRINKDGSKQVSISVNESVRVSDQVTITATADIKGTASIVRYDSRNLSNQTVLVKKAMKNPVLAAALKFYNEAIDSARPLYGIYKALEEIEKSLGSGSKGREKLAKLAGQDKAYVDDVMETAQKTRHHTRYPATERLSEDECRQRAKILIDAYASSISEF